MKYTLVQHSGFTVNGDATFERGLEPKAVSTKEDERAVRAADGVLFDSYMEADDTADQWMYPDGTDGLTPRAMGTFSAMRVGGSPVYQPVRLVVG